MIINNLKGLLIKSLKHQHINNEILSQIRQCSGKAAVLQTHSLKVPSFGGSLWVKCPYKVHVQPTNTMDYPDLDQAFVKVCIAMHYYCK